MLAEDVAEMLEYVPARFKVIRHVRPKLSCAHCQRIARADATFNRSFSYARAEGSRWHQA